MLGGSPRHRASNDRIALAFFWLASRLHVPAVVSNPPRFHPKTGAHTMKGRVVFAALLYSVSTLAMAAPVQWAGNGHYYDYITSATGFSWTAANADAQTRAHDGLTGHLVTVTSAAEEAFLYSTPWLRDNLLYGDPWIGAFRLPGSDLATGWQWVTGEAWTYANWRPLEPNNSWPTYAEYYVHYLSTGVGGANVISGWNDHPDATFLRGYFIEYSTVPEPGSLALLMFGLVGLRVARRR
jgi:hypothetical protein